MAIKDALLPEFDREMAVTRKVLARVPEDKFGWKPHEKSMTLGRLAGHLAEIPGWVKESLTRDSLDMGGEHAPDELTTREAVLAKFDKMVAVARPLIEGASDAQFMAPWTLKNKADWSKLQRLDEYQSPERGWGARTLPPRDRVSSVFFAGNTHDENQPVHLHVADTSICADRCTREFGNPCQNFCPAGVYEMVDDGKGGRRLQINAANCVHCKACDIKDPYEIITWTTPEGGSGPNYQML